MPDIQLKGPAIINGAVRYPVEGAISVTDDDARTQRENDNVDDGDDADDDDGLDRTKVEDLKKLAEEEGVDLGDATKKADIITAIRAHRAAQPE